MNCMIMHYLWLAVRRSEAERNEVAERDRRAHALHRGRPAACGGPSQRPCPQDTTHRTEGVRARMLSHPTLPALWRRPIMGGGTCSGAAPVGPSWLRTRSAQVPPARRCGAPHGMIRCMVTAGRAAHGHRASYHDGGTNDQRRPGGCGGGARGRGRWLLRRGHVARGRRSRLLSPACCMFAPRWRSPRRSPPRSRPSSESALCLAWTGGHGGCVSAASPGSSAWPGAGGGTAELWTPP